MGASDSENLQPGTVLANRYQIESILGQGGMGAVYLGRIEALNKKVAIKEMRVQASDDRRQTQAIEQFRQEAQFLANLEHPNLVQVSDFFVENDRYYLVMAYVRGRNLSEVLQEHPGSPDVNQVLDWALQLTGVLSYLHGQTPPILFRDLKPSNIMLDEQGRIRLIDFGIARSFDPGSATATFLQGMGSAGYSPLEQYQGAGGTDPRSDIYALGATLYHLLTGQVPPSPVELVAGGMGPPSVRKVNPQVPIALDKILNKMMGLRKEERYQSMQQVQQLLEKLQLSLTQADDATENLAVAPTAATRPNPNFNPTRSAPGGNPTQSTPHFNPTRPTPGGNPNQSTPNFNPTRPTPGGGPNPSPVPAYAPMPIPSQPLAPGSSSDNMMLWLTAGSLCLAALALFGWMFLQTRHNQQISQTHTGTTPMPSPVETPASRPLSQPLPPRTQPASVPTRPQIAERPGPRNLPKNPVKPQPPRSEPAEKKPSLPSMTGDHYPVAVRRTPKPVDVTPAAPAPTGPSPQETPTVSGPPPRAPFPQPGDPGYWGNHPGYPRALGPMWVEDDKGRFHPPPDAPTPPEAPLEGAPGTKVVKVWTFPP